ncbi:nuclear envelope phosphatase-regulatory subunit 1 isoform X1 [Mirounga angustirostris]|uniref:nuclear envelope phosphatase-regulatory subunit 1 isoform X1 n=1 Tax=Mirounga angustirostris TaxID=9716 RepID=UPI00313E3D3A
MNSLEQAEDLKAFERRLTEYIHCLQPATGRWRMLLIVVSVCTATGAWNWLIDPETQKVSFFTSLWNHPFFTISCITLIGLFFAGIHKRVVAPSIIAARCRTVLAEYNMSCDDILFIYLTHREKAQVGRETGRERGRSRLSTEQGARRGTRSRDSRIMT